MSDMDRKEPPPYTSRLLIACLTLLIVMCLLLSLLSLGAALLIIL